MDILTVAYYTAIRNVKDWRMLGMLILGPVMLILILGSALDGLIQPREIEQVSVAYLNADQGPVGQGLTAFLQGEQAQEFVALEHVETAEAGMASLANGEVEAFVYVPADLSLATAKGEIASVQVHSSSSTPLVMGFVQNYISLVASNQAVSQMGGSFQPVHHEFVDSSSIKTAGKVPRAIDYFAVHTLLQFMLMGGWYGIGSVQDDREKNTVVRLETAPIKQHSVLLGKLLANIFVLFLQVVVVVAFTKYVYGANWNGSFPVIAATLFLLSALTIGIGMLLGSCFKEGNKAFSALWAIMFFFSVVSGAFGKVQPGSALESLGRLSPNFYASKALFGTIYGADAGLIGSSLLVLLAATVVAFGLALSLGRRKAI